MTCRPRPALRVVASARLLRGLSRDSCARRSVDPKRGTPPIVRACIERHVDRARLGGQEGRPPPKRADGNLVNRENKVSVLIRSGRIARRSVVIFVFSLAFNAAVQQLHTHEGDENYLRQLD